MKRGPRGPSKPLTLDEIAKVKEVVRSDVRDFALFTTGTNTAFRGSDILALNCGDVRGKSEVTVKERKTKKTRTVVLNPAVMKSLEPLVFDREDHEPLFTNKKLGTRLGICSLARLWGDWCEKAGIPHKGGSHCGRKSFSRINYDRGVRIEVIAKSLNHDSPQTTFAYLMLTDEDMRAMYTNEI